MRTYPSVVVPAPTVLYEFVWTAKNGIRLGAVEVTVPARQDTREIVSLKFIVELQRQMTADSLVFGGYYQRKNGA